MTAPRSARAIASTPAGAWLLVRMLAWAAALPVLKRVLPLPTVVKLAARPRASHRYANREQEVAALARWLYARRPVRDDNCLERSLVTYRFLSERGADPVLAIGVRKGADGVLGHAWVTVDGEPVYETPDELVDYATVVTFRADGARDSA
ncbi:MAG: lasso peptide biosynthesis B2 protein [Actinomycetota bacterium]|nr:lasso peptide biosynthesis B2 protein [Actinomycetota bacterium]